MTFGVKQKTDISRFLELAETIPVVDVRSPSEFRTGHIPKAHNIPLFDDKEREVVGTIYREKGRTEAIIEGLRLSGPAMYSKLERALAIAEQKKLLVHCWRGGMRSEAMAWLFSLGDIETEVLEGGYKSYRHHLLVSLTDKRKLIILGGLTGSGKTDILRRLSTTGHQVIDLEGLANHKGSAFGSLGQLPPPTSEHFANLLFEKWKQTDATRPLWLEDESQNIGTVFMPREFYLNMQNNPVIVLLMDVKTRLPRLLEEYSKYSVADLVSSVKRISRRLGGENSGEAIESIEKGNFSRAVEITLRYYDKAYMYSLKKKQADNLIYVETDTDDVSINTGKILSAVKSIPGFNHFFE